MIFTPIALICVLGQAPYECTPETARIVIAGEPAQNEMMCNFYAQAQLAGSSLGRGLRPDEWVKVMCERKAG